MGRRSRSIIPVLVLALMASIGACRCGGSAKETNAEQFFPADVALLVSVPNLGSLSDKARGLIASAKGGPGGSELAGLQSGIARQLGFDPFTREGLDAAGLDPDGTLVLGNLATDQMRGLAALPYKDLSTLEETIARIAKNRSGATVVEKRTHDGQGVMVVTRSAGGAPVFAYATRQHYLLLASGDEPLDRLVAAVRRKPEESIAPSPAYREARDKVGAAELFVFTPRTEAAPRFLPDAALFGLTFGQREVSLAAFVALSPQTSASVAAALTGGGATQLSRLPKGAPAYLRGAVDLAAVMKRLEEEPESKRLLDAVRADATEAGVDFDAEIVGNLTGPFAASFGLAPTMEVQTALNLDPARQNPFENYSLLALAQVKDAAKAAATMAHLGALAKRLGGEVSSREVAGRTLYTASYRLGEGISWLLDGNDLLIAGGFGESLERVISDVGARKGLVDANDFGTRAREALFGVPGAALALDFGKVGESFDQLPESSFGTGPGAYMAKSATTNVVKQLSQLRAVVGVAPAAGGLKLQLSIAAR